MDVQVLGPITVLGEDGLPLDLKGRKQRALLGLLVAASGRVVSVDHLVDQLWGASATDKAPNSVQVYVANLRKVLEPRRLSGAPPEVLVTRAPGYALVLEPGAVDAQQAHRLAASARQLLEADPHAAVQRLDKALSLWRGDAYADLTFAAPDLAAEATRLTDLRLGLLEDRWRARLALGEHPEVTGELEAHVAAHPLREQAWALLVLALYRSQRQGDALGALRRARSALADQLGIDPGPELRDLEERILQQDRALERSDHRGALPSGPRIARPPGGPPVSSLPVGLVGREEQLARLASCLVDATTGHGRLVIVSGEPGIGKTVLARALLDQARSMGLCTGWGACEEVRGAPAMWPWTLALTEALSDEAMNSAASAGTRMAAAARVVPALRTVPDGERPGNDAADTAAFQMTESVAALFREAIGPCALVLDDVHWADPDTLDLIRRIARHIGSLPLVLALVMRPHEADRSPQLTQALGEVARWSPHREELVGLDTSEVSLLLKHRGQQEEPALASWLHGRTGGNPFFLEELVRLLGEVHGGAPLNVERLQDDPELVPQGVQDVVRQRLAEMPARVGVVLGAAAVTGVSFDRDVVVAGSGIDADEAERAVNEAARAGLLVRDGDRGYRFSHALVQDAIRRQVDDDPDLHARVAVAMESAWGRAGDDGLAQIAHHFLRAGRHYARPAWTYSQRAASAAMNQHAPLEAIRLLEAGARAQEGDEDASELDREALLLDLTAARARAGQERAAWQSMRAAADAAMRAGDVVRAAGVVVALGEDNVWSWREYDVVDAQAVELFEQILHALPADERSLRANILAMLGAELYYGPDPDAARALADESVALARTVGSEPLLARVLSLRHASLDRPTLLTERLAIAEELLAMPVVAAHPALMTRALVYRAKDLMEAGQVHAGRADQVRARRLAGQHALVPALLALDYADAVMLTAQGQFAEADRAAAVAAERHAATTLPGAARTARRHDRDATPDTGHPARGGANAACGVCYGLDRRVHRTARARHDPWWPPRRRQDLDRALDTTPGAPQGLPVVVPDGDPRRSVRGGRNLGGQARPARTVPSLHRPRGSRRNGNRTAWDRHTCHRPPCGSIWRLRHRRRGVPRQRADPRPGRTRAVCRGRRTRARPSTAGASPGG